jgi:hypothetical protein
MTKIEIVLQGYFYNHWPELKILLNDKLLFDGAVIDKQTLTFDIECQDRNRLEFVHHNKQLGQNNVWDTDPHTGADCKLQIVDLKFNQVSIGARIKSGLEFTADHADQTVTIIKESDGWMTFNGSIVLDFETPVYDWLIINKFKLEEQKDKAFYSNFTNRWHYEQDIALLDEIRKIMGFDENCGNSCTKT